MFSHANFPGYTGYTGYTMQQLSFNGRPSMRAAVYENAVIDAPSTLEFAMLPTVYNIPIHYNNPVSGWQ
jgi:hypothetical protein